MKEEEVCVFDRLEVDEDVVSVLLALVLLRVVEMVEVEVCVLELLVVDEDVVPVLVVLPLVLV